MKNGQKLVEFRRGVKRYVTIACLKFSICSNYLCVSSNTETVHVFKIDASALEEAERITSTKEDDKETLEASFSFAGFISNAVSSLLPTGVTQDRAFATVQLKESGLKNQVAMVKLSNDLRLLVASEDGFLYVYDFDDTKGGECKLIRVHDLRGIMHDVIGEFLKSHRIDFELPIENC